MTKNGFLNIFIILFSLTLYSCVDAGSGGKRKSSSSQSTSAGADSGTEREESELDLFWFYNGLEIEGRMTINQNIQTVAYLRGNTIHNYLSKDSNASQKYCLVFSYNVGITNNMLRVRAVPISVNNFAKGTLERLLRVDFIDEENNESQCQGNAPLRLASGKIDSTAVSPAYSPQKLCTNCFSSFTSTNITLYKNPNLLYDQSSVVDSTSSITGSLNLTINPENLATDPVGTCSNSECSAKGFDCCVDGQCVNDAAVKPNISLSSTEYIQSQAEIAIDPLNFLKWPDVYFICPNIIRDEPEPPTPTDPTQDADERFQALLKQFNCLEGAKLDSPDYTACDPTFDLLSFETIRDDVWDMCGCDAVGSERATKCPDFGLKAARESDGTITEILCDVPAPDTGPAPTQYLNVPIPVRSIPHRFYDTDGVSWDDVTEIIDKTTKQEGQEFTYTDTANKADPTQTQFSMNAILGSVNLNLSTASPAKMLKVDFDQTYVITVNSGYYTPCPQCSDDAWFTTFKSKPNSYNGTGLQSSGYTTSRDTYGNNLTNGNYEDTIFGRACWLPPTMIPFSHRKNLSLNTQRRNRLTTQAALYVNGYQRDWFGFNQGALIGSFDGVSWFAIGKSRRITSTTEKLYLAINAPFADLADKTDILVNVVTDQGGGTAPDYDYDPTLSLTDARQNQGGSCQENHRCNVDSDCVQRLGWEYKCVDVSKHKAKWPKFDISAQERTNDEADSLNFSKIIVGARDTSSVNRCVYRGSGSLCSTNLGALTENKEMFQCAPNFYCATLESNEFNKELVRSPSQVSNILFGQEADILGRPKDYISSSESVPLVSTLSTNSDGTMSFDVSGTSSTTIIDQIEYNANLYTTIARTELGLCRPGKDITKPDQEAMQNDKDIQGRTDYINQISSCDSSDTFLSTRTRACPVFNELGDYEDPSVINPKLQNMCGAPSVTTLSGTQKSIFFEIEADPIELLASLIQPKVAKDACLRKAGSFCQTDLDCGPNKLHAQTALFYDKSHFGGTEAEHKYWQENLVCGQAQPQPSFSDPDFANYDMSQNRCCREVGKTLTMYTETDSDVVSPSILGSNGINTHPFSSNPYSFVEDITPSSSGRYSRYSVIEHDNSAANFTTSANRTPANTTPIVETRTFTTSRNSSFQWKTMNETGQRTCCGKGWVRKFADGTNDWTQRNRLSINPIDFACLNTKSQLPFTSDPEADLQLHSGTYYSEYSRICASPADNNGCIQNAIPQSAGFEIIPPKDEDSGIEKLSTLPDEDPTNGTLLQVDTLSVNKPYIPSPISAFAVIPADGPFNYIQQPGFGAENVAIVLPSYIAAIEDGGGAIRSRSILRIRTIKVHSGGTSEFDIPHQNHAFVDRNGDTFALEVPYNVDLSCGSASRTYEPTINTWCLQNIDNKIVLKVHNTREATTNNADELPTNDATNDLTYGGIEIDFIKQSEVLDGAGNLTGTTIASEPGNDLYYLTRLAKLELLGVPQIYFEPLYCNNEKEKLVPGIYADDTATRTSIDADAETEWFQYPTYVTKGIENIYENGSGSDGEFRTEASSLRSNAVSHSDGIARPQIWSDVEFMCCLNLGQEVDDPGQCCSGFAPEQDDGSGGTPTRTCQLPSGTNLHVYFNKFISGDGMGSDQPGGGLEDTDFVPETGEIKMNNDALGKINALGAAYCASGEVRRGAAFGFYYAEPNTGSYIQNGELEDSTMWSIVDSNQDYDEPNDTGFVRFLDGFRWNHQVYCK